jgi:hypothetical protein
MKIIKSMLWYYYLLNEYIQRYWTGPPSIASFGKCIGRCSIELEKPGGNILSNLHMITVIFFSNWTKSLILSVLEHKSFKNLLNSAIGFQIQSGSDRKEIGSKHSMNIW